MSESLLRPVRDAEMEMIYRWRNEPRVRKVMPYCQEIDFAAHREWWPKALADPRRRMLILEVGRAPVAAVVFMEVRPGVSAKWGFYTAPHHELRAAGLLTVWFTCQSAAIFYAFEILRVDVLVCDVLATNEAVLRWIDRAGFETIGEELLAGGNSPFIRSRLTRLIYETQFRSSRSGGKAIAIVADERDAGVGSQNFVA